MVWGLKDPSEFGECNPHGEFVGWKDNLKRYFAEEMGDEQRAIYNNWDVDFIERVNRKFDEDLGELHDFEKPIDYRIVTKQKKLGSLLELSGRLLAVSSTLKDVIEKFEPGVHQFWPIDVVFKDKSKPSLPYFGMLIRQFTDSFVPEESSTYIKSAFGDTYTAQYRDSTKYRLLSVRDRKSHGCHLWRERRLISPNILMSDDLWVEIVKCNLKIFSHYKLRVV